MREVREQYDVGIIVGRFQVPELHEAHEQLIRHVCEQHDKVVIFLGVSPLWVTTENPLDFEARKRMILDKFPAVSVLYVKDQWSDEVWSRRLDEMIADVATPAQSVVLYGGRDSFINHYTGKHSTRELEQDTYISGNEIRRDVSRKSVRQSVDFRAGVVWAAYSKFPTVYTTVDVAVFNEDHTKILLGRKPNEDKYRLFGGFADPRSNDNEQDAKREVQEEAGIEIGNLKYVMSCNIDDWRYRREQDKIRTNLFTAKYIHGQPRPGDDIAEVKWFDVTRLTTNDVMQQHRGLVYRALLDGASVPFHYDTDGK
jgi:bifunctional NMN adenylyltransferase/nudix hydrolase